MRLTQYPILLIVIIHANPQLAFCLLERDRIGIEALHKNGKWLSSCLNFDLFYYRLYLLLAHQPRSPIDFNHLPCHP